MSTRCPALAILEALGRILRAVRADHFQQTFSLMRDHSCEFFVDLQVRMAAFEALGSFIATFADPKTTGLYLTADGAVTMCSANGLSPGK